jgi:putrescine importer
MPAPATLQRSLRLPDLVIMGLILIQPTAPMPLFGVVFEKANGHVVTAILIAMLGMMCTAYSYGRMAAVYPSAGSAYTYVGRALHPGLGFVAGWSMLMDYVLNPIICTIWCAKAAANIVPMVPLAALKIFFALVFTALNLRRIEATARTNQVLAAGMGAVILWMLAATAQWVMAQPGPVDFLRPFYDPTRFSLSAFTSATSLAVLTYIGFDAISTLSEEVHDPRRNILRGTVLVCLIIGLLSAVEVYAAQLIWPVGEKFPDVDTAYVFAAERAGGPWLFHAMNFTLLLASIGSGAGAQMAGARLMFGMGREDNLPRSFFGHIDPRSGVPARNVLLIGSFAAIGSLLIEYGLGAELLNFGAFIGFMGVNAAALRHYGFHPVPLCGFLVCAFLWWNLTWPARAAGLLWLAAGIAWGYWATQGFRKPLSDLE